MRVCGYLKRNILFNYISWLLPLSHTPIRPFDHRMRLCHFRRTRRMILILSIIILVELIGKSRNSFRTYHHIYVCTRQWKKSSLLLSSFCWLINLMMMDWKHVLSCSFEKSNNKIYVKFFESFTFIYFMETAIWYPLFRMTYWFLQGWESNTDKHKWI